MSDKELQLPAVDDAVGILDGLYADVFFSKMAEYGLVPPTEEGAVAMLETAAHLDSLPEDNSKSAAADPFVYANSRLQEVLADNNLINTAQYAAQGIKQAAFAYAQNPDLYKAVLSVKAAAAGQTAPTE